MMYLGVDGGGTKLLFVSWMKAGTSPRRLAGESLDAETLRHLEASM